MIFNYEHLQVWFKIHCASKLAPQDQQYQQILSLFYFLLKELEGDCQ